MKLSSHTFTTSTFGLVRTPQAAQLPQSSESYRTVVPAIDTSEDPAELAWLHYLIHETPRGSLYFANETRRQLATDDGLMLVHVTLSMDAIRQSGLVYPSVGCLGATIFAVPLNGDHTLHNFTRYILEREVPMIQQQRPQGVRPALLGLKLLPRTIADTNKTQYGFHYLHIGQLQYDTYVHMKSRFATATARRDFALFETAVVSQIQTCRDFLQQCVTYQLDSVLHDEFFAAFEAALHAMPFLGYIYFEVLSEFVQLFQQDAESAQLHARGELNVRHFKDLVYALAPALAQGFDLEKFQPPMRRVITALKKMDHERKLFHAFDETAFADFMKWRLAQTIRLKALGRQPLPENVTLKSNPALAGHIIHRLIGEAAFMRPYLWAYDSRRAETIWADWRTNHISFVENAVLPRGEVGINPLLPDDAYEVYALEYDPVSAHVTSSEQLAVTMAHALVDGNSLMGSSNNPKEQL